MKTKFHDIKKLLSIIVLLAIYTTNYSAQNILLDSLTLDTVTAFTNLEEALKTPDKVIKLELKRKKYKTFPKEILGFKNLQYLNLSKNNISQLPEEIAQLKSLQYLNVSKNGLEELPPEIGELTNLYFLNANQNDLSSLPPQIGKLQKLKNMDLWSNNIDRFPEELKELKNLMVLDLRVILIPDAEQARIKAMLPNAIIYFSPYCKCAQ